jgi:hypothetical protein
MRCAMEKYVYLCQSTHYVATLYQSVSIVFQFHFNMYDFINDELGFVTRMKV